MKQTAVEWLENEFKEAHKMFGGIDTNWIKRFEQAKEMEKEQIMDAFNGEPHCDGDGDRYYNETFKQQENETDSI